MLSLSCNIQNKKGGYDRILIINHEKSIAHNREFITYTNIDNPVSNYLAPIICENGTYYVDYSLSKEELLTLYNSLSIPAFGNLPDIIKDYAKKDSKIKTKAENTMIDNENGGETVRVTKQKVITSEEINVEDKAKQKVLYIGLNDNEHMIFKVMEENDSFYVCQKITDKDFISIKDNADVIETTFTVPNYYKLVGANNISRANGLYTKVAKKLIVKNSENLHVLIVKYLDKLYSYFVIKNEDNDTYEIEPVNSDYIKKHPYDLVIKTIDNETDYRNFLEKYKKAYHSDSTFIVRKTISEEQKLSMEDTQVIDLSEEDDTIRRKSA